MITFRTPGRLTRFRLPLAATAITLLALPLAACTDNNAGRSADDGSDARALSVQANDDACTISAATAPSGTLRFSVKNDGGKINEFYLLGSDGLRIIGEVENIGPGLTRDLVVSATPGKYFTACKPGMVGDGIRAEFTVSDSGQPSQATADDRQLVDQANQQYAAYVKDQTEQLVTATEKFAALYTAGKDDQARALYPKARVHWERIEPVAESFGDLDPKMDLRQADLEQGQKWTGWHRIEKDLWPERAKRYRPLTAAQCKAYADDLVANTHTLYDRTRKINFTVDQIGNGAKGLMDEVATGKVTGEEEYWSRTDLWDFQANVDGAKVAFEGLRPILKSRDPQLDAQIDDRFAALQKLLDQQRSGDGFVSYDELSQSQVKQLSDAVNALSEPLSKLTAAVV
ncbi:peptidase M75 family protein [Microlunatus elymi]|uniref:Peptidase M75 family protein n=1 Tax=Microlunatus elymi TaxID=2596828 RepID=A0A516PUX0_9ACTN|nr:iron uptake system protein EfeO [Microlunatus elymi]QDP94930.1 peptidase M75 family protein [Microlunatus elymi]